MGHARVSSRPKEKEKEEKKTVEIPSVAHIDRDQYYLSTQISHFTFCSFFLMFKIIMLSPLQYLFEFYLFLVFSLNDRK